MPSPTTPVDRFLCTGKRCLKAFRSFAVRRKKPRTEETGKLSTLRRRDTFYFSTTSLDKRRRSADSESIDTIITWLDDACCLDNHINETLENNREMLLL